MQRDYTTQLEAGGGAVESISSKCSLITCREYELAMWTASREKEAQQAAETLLN